MIKDGHKIVLISCMILLFLATASFSFASSSLSSLDARFEVFENGEGRLTDVKVELRLTYGKYDREQTKDMKLVEADSLESVEVVDGAGKPLGFKIVPGTKVSKIVWDLNGETEKPREVTIRFTLPNSIREKEGRSVFGAYWVGGWIVPVENARYQFIFPTGYAYSECSVYPQYGHEAKEADGKWEITVTISPLKGESFALAFAPSLDQWEAVSRQPAKLAARIDENKKTDHKKQDPTGPENKKPDEGLGNEKSREIDETDSVHEIDIGEMKGSVAAIKEVLVAEKQLKKGEESKVSEEQPHLKEEEKVKKTLSLVTEFITPVVDQSNCSSGERQSKNADENRVFTSALELIEQEKYSEALKTLRYFTSTFSQSVLSGDVSFLIGECYFQLAERGILRSYQPAVDAFQLALALYPGVSRAHQGLFQMAYGLRKMGYYFEAQDNYQLLIDKYPQSASVPDAHFWIAETRFQREEYKDAKDLFRYFIVKYPKNDYVKQATFRVADCYVGLKEYGEAEEKYKEALDRWSLYSGLFPETFYYLGLSYFRNKHYAKARSIFFRALNIFPEQPYNHIIVTKIGDTYREEGKEEQAHKVYSQNDVLYPDSKGALISEIKMANLEVNNPGFFNFIQYLEPLEVFQKVIEKYPATDLAEETRYYEGVDLVEPKRSKECTSSLLAVLEKYPDSEISEKCFNSLQKNLVKLINSHFADEHYYSILEVYYQYKEPFLSGIKDTNTLFQIGESFRKAGFYDEALELYGKAKGIYPPNHSEDELTFRVGEIYLHKKAYDKAAKLFEKIITTFPDSKFYERSLHSLADTYFEQKRYDEAHRTYRAALENDMKSIRGIKSLFRLGKCYQAMKEETLTVETFEQTIRVAEDLSPVDGADKFVIEGYFTLADFLYQIQRYADAIKVYTQAIERFPENERAQWALYRIAATYRNAGKGNTEDEFFKKLAASESEEFFWKTVAGEQIRNLEWGIKSREYLAP
ncbi:tetratricopeptide repeat protein [bacterium]|nr:MAG: tetratricopeptide repeat protein [bacterium]